MAITRARWTVGVAVLVLLLAAVLFVQALQPAPATPGGGGERLDSIILLY